MRKPSPTAAFLAVLLAGPAGAEPADTALQRRLELPAHRLLIEVIRDPATELAPFTTDGCSGGLSSSWTVVADLFPDFAAAHQGRPPWEDCCIAHDRRYHGAGGATTAEASYAARLAADEALRACVETTGEGRIADLSRSYGVTADQVRRAYAAIAAAMFNAVRFGGGPCTGLPWRWGYGYPGCLWPPG